MAKHFEAGDNVSISENVRLVGQEIRIGSDTHIHRGVAINSRVIVLGDESTIEDGLQFSGYGSRFEKNQAEKFLIGDNVFMGFRSRITAPMFSVGDYSVLHNNLSIYGPAGLTIGHNAWIGQETIVNTRRSVIMGDNVRIGARTQIWTHSASGELIEGAALYSEKEVVLEDNTWLNGSVTISPGVTVKSWSVVLTGAVLTKDTKPYHLYAGVPARDITDRIRPYNVLSLDDKYEVMRKLVKEFLSTRPEYSNRVFLVSGPEDVPSNIPDRDVLVILRDAKGNFAIKGNCVIDISTKKYRKVRSRIEMDFIKANLAHNARFVPI